jgi:hypothetical protein
MSPYRIPIPPQKMFDQPKVDRSPDEYPTIPSAQDSREQIPPSQVTPFAENLGATKKISTLILKP